MVFTSSVFLIFFCITFAIYWSVLHSRPVPRNWFLLLASYVFYGWWDWRFLSLIFVSSVLDYAVALLLGRESQASKRKALLFCSLFCNLGMLFFFKYFNFFSDSLQAACGRLGIELGEVTLNVVLPVGISFYTFQTLSYTIDIYRRRMEPTKDLVAFLAYVSFFPQLVAGPIERAEKLLPQFFRKAIPFDYHFAMDGLRMILWGFFLKAVLADNLAPYVESIFQPGSEYGGSTRALGLVYFAFQIFGDFAGYSLIARGVARLFGFDLMVNFRAPYFSRDIAEFWRRWHISLSTWFRDYVYIPLGGNRGTTAAAIGNIFVVFVLSGLWHGANWTFLVWGLVNALLYVPIFVFGLHRKNNGGIAEGRLLPGLRDACFMALNFSVVCLAWTFFRAENLGHAIEYLSQLFSPSLFSIPQSFRGGLPWIGLAVVVEWFDRDKDVPIRFAEVPKAVRWFLYLALLSVIFYRGYFSGREFIYFQF
jgi:D-alanyl-lipoteichoic acid acyltransferase DltB (MBOAT superfamily)